MSLTKTLDDLKRLTPDLHDSLILSRHRMSLYSLKLSKRSVRSVIKKKKKRPRLSPVTQWYSINLSTSTLKPLTQVDLHCLHKQKIRASLFKEKHI